jgi:drug/metabolite transporter (DMT)-like permease
MEVLFLRAAKTIGALALVLWLSVLGTAFSLPLALASGTPPGGYGALAPAAGVALVGFAGALLYFLALQHGQLAVVSPLVAMQAAFSVIIAVAVLDEVLGPGLVVGLVLAAAGVALATLVRSAETPAAVPIALACAASALFGTYNVLLAETADDAGPLWSVLAFRLVSLVVLLPWAVRAHSLYVPPGSRVAVVAGSALETIGFVALAVALERGPVAVVAVVAVQYSTIAVALAGLVLHERLRRRQWVGVVLVLASVALIAGTR